MATVGSLFVEIGADIKKLDKGLKQANKKIDGFSSGIKKIGGLVAGAFAAEKILSFTKEAIRLAGELKGVEGAFNALNSPTLLDELRDATKGTVSDLELMKKAVQAKNLGLPIQKLGTFFEFARRRAKETGESVDFLVNSIVNGIGRKSPLILDNLGISAQALRDRMKEVGDFGEAAGQIIEESLEGMTADVDTSTEASAQLGATWDNLSAALGERLTPAVQESNVALTRFLKVVSDLIKIEDDHTEQVRAGRSRLFAEFKGLTKEERSIRKKTLNEQIAGLSQLADFERKRDLALAEQTGTFKQSKATSALVQQVRALKDQLGVLDSVQRDLDETEGT